LDAGTCPVGSNRDNAQYRRTFKHSYTTAMLVELTPRSAEIIAREQAQNGAISPENLFEQALETFSGTIAEPSWYSASPEECRAMIAKGLEHIRQGRTYSAEDVFREMDRIANGG